MALREHSLCHADNLRSSRQFRTSPRISGSGGCSMSLRCARCCCCRAPWLSDVEELRFRRRPATSPIWVTRTEGIAPPNRTSPLLHLLLPKRLPPTAPTSSSHGKDGRSSTSRSSCARASPPRAPSSTRTRSGSRCPPGRRLVSHRRRPPFAAGAAPLRRTGIRASVMWPFRLSPGVAWRDPSVMRSASSRCCPSRSVWRRSR
jgi:hypothetical protein